MALENKNIVKNDISEKIQKDLKIVQKSRKKIKVISLATSSES